MPLKILYISALPRDQHSIPVEGEYKVISDAVARSRYRHQIEGPQNWPGISLDEFQSVIERFQPDVLHFSGHATKVGDLVFQGPEEESQRVPKDPFANAFNLLAKNLKLVFLSACYAKDQAEKVVQHVDRVIGTDKEIEANKAVIFSKMFYESIGNGESVEEAFKKAENELSINKKEGESLPTLILLKRTDSGPLFLIETPKNNRSII